MSSHSPLSTGSPMNDVCGFCLKYRSLQFLTLGTTWFYSKQSLIAVGQSSNVHVLIFWMTDDCAFDENLKSQVV